MNQKQRRPVMLDSDTLSTLKDIASKYGMTLSSYLRALFSGVIDVESKGFFAPAIIRRTIVLNRLTKLGFSLVPRQVLDSCTGINEEELVQLGRNLGSTLRFVGVEFTDLLDLVTENMQNVLREDNKVLLLPSNNRTDNMLRKLIKGIAEGYNLNTREEGDAMVIELQSNT